MKNNWININDGLPQHSKYVLVHVNGSSKYFLAWYNEITKWISTKTNFRVNFMKGEL